MDAKKGDAGYDPCSKYDFIYKVLIHNMNYVTKFADLDATIDESTWGFGGFSGECGGQLINKPVSRGKYKMPFIDFSLIMLLILLPWHYIIRVITCAGGQIAMISDINHRYPKAYVHQHKLHLRHPPFKAIGQSEVVMLVGMIDLLLKDRAADANEPKIAIQNPTSAMRLEYTLKQVYTKPPHITADNIFLSETIIEWLGGKGYGLTATCARDKIPTTIKPYTHHTKVDSTHLRELKAKGTWPAKENSGNIMIIDVYFLSYVYYLFTTLCCHLALNILSLSVIGFDCGVFSKKDTISVGRSKDHSCILHVKSGSETFRYPSSHQR